MIVECLNSKVIDSANPSPCSVSEEGPLKNAFCPYYGNCIDWALEERWSQFTCRGCSFQDAEMKIEPSDGEMAGYYRLLSKIFTGKA